MTCTQFAKYLQAYCDGELDVSKMLEVDAHLEACPGCRGTVEVERTFRDALRGKLRPEPVAPHVEGHLRSALAKLEDEERRSSRRPIYGRWTWAVAASVILLVVGALLVIRPSERQPTTQAILPALVREHLRSARLEAPVELKSGSAQQVAFWFRGKIGHAVFVPDYDPMGVQLLGGRVIQLEGTRAASVVYRKGGNVLSLFGFAATPQTFAGLRPIERDAQMFLAAELSGQQILLWQRGEMMYALVSDIGWDALFQCARAFFETART